MTRIEKFLTDRDDDRKKQCEQKRVDRATRERDSQVVAAKFPYYQVGSASVRPCISPFPVHWTQVLVSSCAGDRFLCRAAPTLRVACPTCVSETRLVHSWDIKRIYSYSRVGNGAHIPRPFLGVSAVFGIRPFRGFGRFWGACDACVTHV